MRVIRVFVPVHPGDLRVNAAYRRTKAGGVRTSSRYETARARVAEALVLAADGRVWAGPVRVRLRAVWPATGRTGDVDGPIKGTLDAVQDSGLIPDDHQVQEVSAVREIGEIPGVWLEVEKI